MVQSRRLVIDANILIRAVLGRRVRELIARRDENDWPAPLAAAMQFDCPVWTEDADFFGAGVPTWTTDTVEICLRSD